MSGYVAFLKKELLEHSRTYKIFIMLVVFCIFGIMSPLFAKLMPDLLASVMPKGMNIVLAKPTAIDSWAQFYKNTTQMGIIVTILVFGGILASELAKGTLINMLTKGLSRTAVILSKYTCMALIWTASLAACFLITWGYTVYLFPGDKTVHVLFSVFCLWVFGLFLLAAQLFAATLTRSSYGSLLLAGGVAVVCMLINIVPAVHKYNPVSLASDNVGLVAGSVTVSSLTYAVIIAAVLAVGFVWGAVMVFRKKLI